MTLFWRLTFWLIICLLSLHHDYGVTFNVEIVQKVNGRKAFSFNMNESDLYARVLCYSIIYGQGNLKFLAPSCIKCDNISTNSIRIVEPLNSLISSNFGFSFLRNAASSLVFSQTYSSTEVYSTILLDSSCIDLSSTQPSASLQDTISESIQDSLDFMVRNGRFTELLRASSEDLAISRHLTLWNRFDTVSLRVLSCFVVPADVLESHRLNTLVDHTDVTDNNIESSTPKDFNQLRGGFTPHEYESIGSSSSSIHIHPLQSDSNNYSNSTINNTNTTVNISHIYDNMIRGDDDTDPSHQIQLQYQLNDDSPSPTTQPTVIVISDNGKRHDQGGTFQESFSINEIIIIIVVTILMILLLASCVIAREFFGARQRWRRVAPAPLYMIPHFFSVVSPP